MQGITGGIASAKIADPDTKMSVEARLGICHHGILVLQLNNAYKLYFFQLGVALSAK
ncbi:hypothetical protein [Alteromonas lipolytica]|uniref:hypothetical protein n=1 Tax=Alteromonas lipolytica TaxID=1856405 RepID=UPI0015867C12|nr:hypothetical protein [Alteromonas lipolytica]